MLGSGPSLRQLEKSVFRSSEFIGQAHSVLAEGRGAGLRNSNGSEWGDCTGQEGVLGKRNVF